MACFEYEKAGGVSTALFFAPAHTEPCSRVQAEDGASGGVASGCCMDFHKAPGQDHIYLVRVVGRARACMGGGEGCPCKHICVIVAPSCLSFLPLRLEHLRCEVCACGVLLG